MFGSAQARGRRARERYRRRRQGLPSNPPAAASGHDPAVLRLAAIVVAIVAVASLGMGFVMAMAMGDMMDNMGGMMGGGGPQGTPVVLDQAAVNVDITGYAFKPAQISVPRGTKVIWTNHDGVPHTATENDKRWETGVLQEDQSRTLTFDTPGTYPYYCTIHPYMKGAVIVR